MIVGIDHIGVAVESHERSLPFWAEALGLAVTGFETVPSEGVRVAFLGVGSSRIELLEPQGETSPVGKFLARSGAGMHHLTLAAHDLPAVLERLRSRGAELVGGGEREGAGGSRVAFVHPRSTGGVLLELVARPEPASAGLFEPGSVVVAYLREPSEKLWGVLRRLDPAGMVIEGIDLGSFDDWLDQIEQREENVVGPSLLFVPMGRVERLLLDRSSGDLASLGERFRRRTGRTVHEVLGWTP